MTQAEPGDVRQFPSVRLLGVRIHAIARQRLLRYIDDTLSRGERAVIGYANAHALNLAYESRWFRDFLNRCEVVFCDGFGVKWAARLTGQRIPERYTPPDWIDELCQLCAVRGFSLFFVGARPGVADEAARILCGRHEGLRIAGVQHGYFDKEAGAPDNEEVIAAIGRARPHVLLVGFGMPMQERWIDENWPRLRAQVALPVGAMFDYVAGHVTRGPRWMTDHGLEWLARLAIEPARLGRRYLVGNPRFLFRVIRRRKE